MGIAEIDLGVGGAGVDGQAGRDSQSGAKESAAKHGAFLQKR